MVVTTTARDSMWGPTIPELVEALPGLEIVDRSSVNAYDDARVARAIEATGRKKLIFAGLSLEVCAALPAMQYVLVRVDGGKGLRIPCLHSLQQIDDLLFGTGAIGFSFTN